MRSNAVFRIFAVLVFGIPIFVIWPYMTYRVVVDDQSLDQMLASYMAPYLPIALFPGILLLIFVPTLGTRKQRRQLRDEGRATEARVLAIGKVVGTEGADKRIQMEIELTDKELVLNGLADVPELVLAQVQPGCLIPVITDGESFVVDAERMKRVAA